MPPLKKLPVHSRVALPAAKRARKVGRQDTLSEMSPDQVKTVEARLTRRKATINALCEELALEEKAQDTDMALLLSWGFSYRQIADRAGVSPQTVINRLSRLRPFQEADPESSEKGATVAVDLPKRSEAQAEGKRRSEKFLTVKQAAKRAQTSDKTIRRRIADRSLPAGRIGRLVRISEEDLLEFMQKTSAVACPA
jgi:excisionase family DNA binding protein